MKKIVKKYPCFLVLLAPRKRDDVGWVKDWTVLNTTRDVPSCERALEYYRNEGFNEVVAFSTYTDESSIQVPQLPARVVAAFYRVLFGTEGGAYGIGCSSTQ